MLIKVWKSVKSPVYIESLSQEISTLGKFVDQKSELL